MLVASSPVGGPARPALPFVAFMQRRHPVPPAPLPRPTHRPCRTWPDRPGRGTEDRLPSLPTGREFWSRSAGSRPPRGGLPVRDGAARPCWARESLVLWSRSPPGRLDTTIEDAIVTIAVGTISERSS